MRRRRRVAVAALPATALVIGAFASPHGRLLQAVELATLLVSLWHIGEAIVRALALGLAPLSRILAAFTFAVAFGSVTATLLGHAGVLRPAPFLLVVAAAVLAASWLPDRAVEVESLGAEAESRGGLVARVETMAAVATGGAMVFGYVVEAVRRFALPLHGGPDDISYHLSAIAVWQRWGDLRMLKFSMGDWGTAFYPLLPELSSWMLLAPFRDSDVAARWSELFYAVASLLAVAAVARRLGVGRRGALLAAALYGVLRPVAALAFAAGNDHVTAFFTLAALDAALAAAERPRLGRFAYLGTALGLLVASKYFGIFNAATVLALFVVALVLRRRRRLSDAREPRPRPVFALAVLLGTIALAGGYSYLRNWVSTGNPLYPQPVRFGSYELFAGREELSLGVRGGDERLDLWDLLAGPDNAFAAFFPFTLLPAAIVAPLLAAWRRRWLDAAVLALPVIFFLEYLHLVWDHSSIRFVFAGVALGGVAFVWLTEQLGAIGAWLRAVTFGVVLLRYARWLEVRGEWELVAALALVAAAVLVSRTWPRWRSVARVRARQGLVLSIAAVTLVLGCNVDRYQRSKLAGSPAAMALERLAGGRGATVGYVGLNQPYLFFGSRLQNDVRIVPRSFNLRAEHYRWGGAPERPYPRSTYRRWLGVVKTLGIEYVVVVRSPDEDPERSWMANHWERFRRVHVDDTTEIWKLLPAPPQQR
jgi:hypothetical protein